MAEHARPNKREADGWKVAIVLGETLLGVLVTVSILQYNSSACIEDSLQKIEITLAQHLGEHMGISDRITKLEAQAKRHANR